ncbi:hypothetical protein Tco_0229914, partial [Tanacetum coccineum]
PDTTIPSTEIPVAPIPPAPSVEIATAPPACDTLTPVITASPAIRSHIRTTAKKTLSFDTSSSSTSLDSASHTSESSFTTSLQGTQISLEDHSHHSSEVDGSPSGPLTHRRPHCSDYATPTSSSSVGPFRKRSRSSATSIPSTVHTTGALTGSS